MRHQMAKVINFAVVDPMCNSVYIQSTHLLFFYKYNKGQSNLAFGGISALKWQVCLRYTGQGVPTPKSPLSLGGWRPLSNTMSLPNGISFHLTALAGCISLTDTLWNSLLPHLRDADLSYSRFRRSFLFGYSGAMAQCELF